MSSIANLLDFIGSAEAGPAGYQSTWGNVANRDFSTMTLDEVIADSLARGQQYGSGATGRYQFMGKTLEGLKRNLGLTGAEPFTPEFQDALATELMREKGLDQFLTGGMTPEEFGSNLARTWAGLPTGPGNRSQYEGVMGNRATTTWDEMMRVLGGGEVQAGGGFTGPIDTMTAGLPGRRQDSLIHPQIAELFGQPQMQGGPASFLGDPWISLGAHILNARGTPGVFGSGIAAGIESWNQARREAGQNQLDTRLQMLQASNELYALEEKRREYRRETAQQRRQEEARRSFSERLRQRGQVDMADMIDAGLDIPTDVYEDYLSPAGETQITFPEGMDPGLAEQVRTGQLKMKDAITIADQRRRHAETMEGGLRDDFERRSAAPKQVLDSWNAVRDITPEQINTEGGKLDGELVKRYSKMVLPNEAVMSDDMRVVMDQNRNILESYTRRLARGESLSPPERREIMQRMQQLATIARDEYARIAQEQTKLGESYPGVNPSRIIIGQPPEYYEHPAVIEARREQVRADAKAEAKRLAAEARRQAAVATTNTGLLPPGLDPSMGGMSIAP